MFLRAVFVSILTVVTTELDCVRVIREEQHVT